MDRRFAFKDLLVVTLLVVAIVLTGVAMMQFDRQWDDVRAIRDQVQTQIEAQAGLEERLARLDRRLARLAERPGVSAELTQQLQALLQDGAVSPEALAELPVQAEQQGPQEAIPDTDVEAEAFDRLMELKQRPDFAMGDWLVDAFSGGVAKLTPLLSGDVYASIVQDMVLETLAVRDPETLEWKGLLAEGWRVDDRTEQWEAYVQQVEQEQGIPRSLLIDALGVAGDDEQWQTFAEGQLEQGMSEAQLAALRSAALATPDVMVVDFDLREGARFSDGEPVTAEDVVFTYDFIMDPAINAPRHRAYYRRIHDVEQVDEDTVRFRFKEPYFEGFELAAGFQVLPSHFYGQFDPQTFNQSVGLLLGSGPYRLEDPTAWKPGQQIALVRNERYWGVDPAFNRLVFKEITNDVPRLTAYRNGEIDVFTAQPEQYREMLDDASLMNRSQEFAYASAIGGYRYIAWNQRRNDQPTKFADRRVRQAMTLLTDRQRLVNEVMLGYAEPATGPFNPLGKQHNASVEPWPYDVAKAKQLLAAAGWKDRDGDGVIENEQGQPFRFTLTYPSGSPNYEKMALFLKDAYARAGIILVPDPLEWSVFTERLGNKNFDAITLMWSSGIETDIFQMFHSTQAKDGGDNFVSYANPELDRLIELARQSLDEDERLPLWKQAHEVLHEDQPYTFLFFPQSLRFIDERLQNVEEIRLGLTPRTEWYVPRTEQKYTP